jgi:Na+-translocating ferredoxin:NAD+ oxidoreductase RnfD subunit
MPENVTPPPRTAAAEPLDDAAIRARQLETHLLRSPEYLHRADQELKRQVSLLYLAVALLLLFQGLFSWRAAGQIPFGLLALTGVTSILAVVNCLLLIRTKNCLRKLNAAWLKPEERSALEALRNRRGQTSGGSGAAE